MRSPVQRLRREDPWNVMMTPMIDVVFLLLIFFVCTASFQMAELILPSELLAPTGAGQADTVDPQLLDFELIVVGLRWQDGQPTWEVNGTEQGGRADLQKTLTTIAQIKSDLPVVIDPASHVPLGAVIDVYDVARLVGFSKIQFAAAEEGS